MKISKNKLLLSISLILLLTVTGLIASLPLISAHDPPADQTTYAYIELAPNPVGVDQTAFVVM